MVAAYEVTYLAASTDLGVTLTTPATGASTPYTFSIAGSRPPGSRAVTATVSTAAAGQDPSPDNNSDSANVSVVISTDLSTSLTVAPTSVAEGSPFTASAAVANAGPSDLATGEATVTIDLGDGLALSGDVPSGCATSTAGVTCALGPVAGGATWTSPAVTIVGTAGTRTITATVATTSPGQDPEASNDSASASVTVLAPPSAALSPTSVDFGDQPVGTTSASQTVTVTNTGDSPLKISVVATSGDFAVAGGSSCAAEVALAPHASCSVVVTFTPTAGGARTGALTVADDGTPSPHTVATAAVEVTVKVVAPGASTITSTASVTATSDDPSTSNNSATVTTRVFGRR